MSNPHRSPHRASIVEGTDFASRQLLLHGHLAALAVRHFAELPAWQRPEGHQKSKMGGLTCFKHGLLVGGFNPSEKYENKLGLLFPIYIYIYMEK